MKAAVSEFHQSEDCPRAAVPRDPVHECVLEPMADMLAAELCVPPPGGPS